ncbi:MAG: SulP family inorganic anion transporter [Acidobacteriota bacterium]
MATQLERLARYLSRPVPVLAGWSVGDLRPDVVAGLTVAVVAVPQAMAYAAIAHLPASYGLYSAVVASIVGALWGSSRHLSTGPTNAASILVLSILAPLVPLGSPEFLVAASLMAVLVGAFRIFFGFAGFGLLVNFASRAVLLGFTAGAAVLIAVGQLPSLLGVPKGGATRFHHLLAAAIREIPNLHVPTLAVGLGAIAVTLLTNRFLRKLPGALIAMVLAGAAVGAGIVADVAVVGAVPRSLPAPTPIDLPALLASDLFEQLLVGALAVAVLGLFEAVSIARAIARSTGERLDINQEFVGQGLANVATGLLSGYTCSGSFTRSAVNHQAGARTAMSSVFAGLFVLAAILAFGPFAAFLPSAALAGLLMLVSWNMIDREGIRRVLRTSRTEGAILVATLVATLLLPLEFAVLSGVLLSLALYLYEESLPRVTAVVPDEQFRHFVERAGASACPQLGVLTIRGSLFFGAASHVEDELLANLGANPGQHLLLLRMHGVNRLDISGVEMLEGLLRLYRDQGGDVFMVQVRAPVREVMRQSGFEATLGADHFLAQEEAIDWLFAHRIDPAVCCYECDVRVFAECQALVKHPYDATLPPYSPGDRHPMCHLTVEGFEEALRAHEREAVVLDVREAEEYERGHLPGARNLPLRSIIEAAPSLDRERPLFLVCRSGRRSTRAMNWLLDLGFPRVCNLKGGILSWQARGRPLDVD